MAGTTRRDFGRQIIGGFTVAALAGSCGDPDSEGGTADGPGGGGADASPSIDATPTGGDGASCTVYPQETEGPFYLDLDQLRRDVTEDKPGARLNLTVQVVAAGTCAPLRDVAVDIWQCDAAGVYSGFPGQLGGLDTTGQTFLRGTQVTGDDGRVQFVTIYPGWYPGRTTHIHFKVRLASREATSQLYFPETVTSAVYATAPYDVRGQKDTTNDADATAHVGGFPPLLVVTDTGTAFEATLTVTVAS